MTVSLTRSETVACVQFSIEDDIIIESDEAFGVELAIISQFAITRYGRTMANVAIEDNDQRKFPTQLAIRYSY